MRVLMVGDDLNNGGAERQLALLAASLPEPWSVSVLSMEGGPYRSVLERHGIDVRITPRQFRYDITAAARMLIATATMKPDIVHSWGWMSTRAVLPYCRVRGVPLLGTIRRGDWPPGRPVVDRANLSRYDMIVANSRAGLAAYGIAEDDRGRVVYNGFDPGRLEAAAMALGNVTPHEGTVVIMAARMHPAKDWRLLFRAARTLAQDKSGWRFIAVLRRM